MSCACAYPALRFTSSVVILTGILIFMICGGCKRLRPNSSPGPTAQLSSIVDDDYILMMVVADSDAADPKDSPAQTELYEFMTCAVQHIQDINTGRWPGWPDSRGFKSRIPGTTKGVRYQMKLGLGGQAYDFYVLNETCVPTYQNQAGESFKLKKSDVNSHMVGSAVNHLKVQRDRTDIQQGHHHIAAFGFGAMFQGFSSQIRQAVLSLLPKGAIGKPFLAFMSQIGLTAPFGTPGQILTEKFEDKGYVVVMPHTMKEQAKQPPHQLNAEDWALSTASGAAGYGTAHVIVQASSKAGPWGAIAGYLVVPFIATVVVHSGENHARDLLDHFQEIFAIRDPQNMSTVLNSGTAATSSIVEVSRILGQTLRLSGWGLPEQMTQYCFPNEDHSRTCQPL